MGSPDKVQSWGLMLALLQNGHCSRPSVLQFCLHQGHWLDLSWHQKPARAWHRAGSEIQMTGPQVAGTPALAITAKVASPGLYPGNILERLVSALGLKPEGPKTTAEEETSVWFE